MNDTVGTLAGGSYSNKDIVAAVLLEVDIHVFVVIYGSFVIKEYKVNSPLPCLCITTANSLWKSVFGFSLFRFTGSANWVFFLNIKKSIF